MSRAERQIGPRMRGLERGLLVARAPPHHGIAPLLLDGGDELERLLGRVGVVAIHHDEVIGLRQAEEPLDGVSFALSAARLTTSAPWARAISAVSSVLALSITRMRACRETQRESR